MAYIGGRSPRVIARIFSTYSTEFAELTWEWIIRVDGQACYRLRELRGRRERNPWRPVTRLDGADLRAFAADTASQASAWSGGTTSSALPTVAVVLVTAVVAANQAGWMSKQVRKAAWGAC